jgi:hypothetical protein
MAWLSGLLRRFRKTTFRSQLAILFSAGVLCISLLAALITSWQGSRQLYASKLDDGLRITRNLASQSRLALAFGSTENVAEALAAASAFPDVTRIAIRQADGRILLEKGKPFSTKVIVPLPNVRDPYLDAESADGWRFVAPVWSVSGPDSQFETTVRHDILLGFVIIDQSKATLKTLVHEVFVVNFAAGIAFRSFSCSACACSPGASPNRWLISRRPWPVPKAAKSDCAPICPVRRTWLTWLTHSTA